MSFKFENQIDIYDKNIDFDLQCPECELFFNYKEWIETAFPCEECGYHWGLECPGCHEAFDHIWDSDKLENIKD